MAPAPITLMRRAAAALLVVACACGGGGRPSVDDVSTDVTDTTDATDARGGLPENCGLPTDGPGLSRAGPPGPIVYQEADGEGLVVADPDGTERGRITAPHVGRGVPVGTAKALYELEAGGLLLVDAEALKATPLPGPVTELATASFGAEGGRRFLPVVNFGGDGSEIVEIDVASATDVADIIGGGADVNGVHIDDTETNVAIFTGHGVWVTDTNFLEDATQVDAQANGRGDITADGCALAYFRGDADAATLDVVVANVDDARPGTKVATVTVSPHSLPDLQWVGRRLVLCDADGAAVIDPADGSVESFGQGRCTDVVRDLHRSEALVNVGDTVDTHWFHVGPDGAPEPLDELAGYNAVAVSANDLVPLSRDFTDPYLIYSFADHRIRSTSPLPPAQSGGTDDLVPGYVLKVETRFDGTTRMALVTDLRGGEVHTVASAPAETGLGLPAPAPDGSAVVAAVGTRLSIVSVPAASSPEIPIGDGSVPVWTVADLEGGTRP